MFPAKKKTRMSGLGTHLVSDMGRVPHVCNAAAKPLTLMDIGTRWRVYVPVDWIRYVDVDFALPLGLLLNDLSSFTRIARARPSALSYSFSISLLFCLSLSLSTFVYFSRPPPSLPLSLS